MLGAESQGVKRTSGAELQRVRRFIRSQVVGSQAVLWELSRREPHGTHTYVESGEAESHAVHQEQSHREPHIMSGSELQEVMLYIWS